MRINKKPWYELKCNVVINEDGDRCTRFEYSKTKQYTKFLMNKHRMMAHKEKEMTNYKEALVVTAEMGIKIMPFETDNAHVMLHDEVQGFIERVQLPTLGVDMWLNENGKNTGLPQNNFATFLFEKEHKSFDSIRGNVVFTGEADEKGETLGLTSSKIKQLLDFLARMTKLIESTELTDDQLANCRRHGGAINPVNCWECLVEAREENDEPDWGTEE